jgi:regulator of RNase E activity RraA
VTIDEALRQIPPGVLEQLRTLDARLRNEGFTDLSVRCLSPSLPPMVGYAATGRMRTMSAPTAQYWYHERMDMDSRPGVGALFGEIHAHIGRALGCIGYVTNCAVRDLPSIERIGFHLFAGNVSVSHAYAHVVDFGEPVDVGGLRVNPGDLLHGDLHGVVSVPAAIAGQIPKVAAELQAQESELIHLCQPEHFSMEKLRSHIERTRYVSK